MKVYGIGINDANYKVTNIDGKNTKCVYYATWSRMLQRCYSENSLLRRPTYFKNEVCDEWLHFMTFRKWMIKQNWKNKHLDKDIRVPNNKVYSPKFCHFVPIVVNLAIRGERVKESTLPPGVNVNPRCKTISYRARVRFRGYHFGCGTYQTIDEAHVAYLKGKISVFQEMCLRESEGDIVVINGLKKHIELFEEQIIDIQGNKHE